MGKIIDLESERSRLEAEKRDAHARRMLGYNSPPRSGMSLKDYKRRLQMTFDQINDVEERRKTNPDHLMEGIEKPEA